MLVGEGKKAGTHTIWRQSDSGKEKKKKAAGGTSGNLNWCCLAYISYLIPGMLNPRSKVRCGVTPVSTMEAWLCFSSTLSPHPHTHKLTHCLNQSLSFLPGTLHLVSSNTEEGLLLSPWIFHRQCETPRGHFIYKHSSTSTISIFLYQLYSSSRSIPKLLSLIFDSPYNLDLILIPKYNKQYSLSILQQNTFFNWTEACQKKKTIPPQCLLSLHASANKALHSVFIL